MYYFDNAATSWPKPNEVYNEMVKCMRLYAGNPGRSGHSMSLKASEKIYECRSNIAKLFGIDNELCVTFTSNATESLNIGIKGILNDGDHVITSSMEHNSVVRPLKKLEAQGKITLSVVQTNAEGFVNVDDIKNAITNNTKLIVIIHASNVVGSINPIMEIGKIANEKGIIFMVDAAQTAGVVPIDVKQMGIDILAFPGHKGLLGPQGTGGLYVKESILLDTLKEGGTGSESENPFQPIIIPDRYESGTLNTPGIAALNEGVKYILNNGVEAISDYESALTKYLIDGLKNIPEVILYGACDIKKQVGTVSMNISQYDCINLCNYLDKKYEIALRGGLHCAHLAHSSIGTLDTGTARISVGCFNNISDIDYLIDALYYLIKNNI